MTLRQLPFTLQELRTACLEPTLADRFIQALQDTLGGVYHGHQEVGHGVYSIFLAAPRWCMSQSRRTIRLDQELGDRTVSCAFIDYNQEDQPLSLDLYP